MYEEQRYQSYGHPVKVQDYNLDPPEDPTDAATDGVEEDIRNAVDDDEAIVTAFQEVVECLACDDIAGSAQLAAMVRGAIRAQQNFAIRKAVLHQMLENITGKLESDEDTRLAGWQWNRVRSNVRYRIEKGDLL